MVPCPNAFIEILSALFLSLDLHQRADTGLRRPITGRGAYIMVRTNILPYLSHTPQYASATPLQDTVVAFFGPETWLHQHR